MNGLLRLNHTAIHRIAAGISTRVVSTTVRLSRPDVPNSPPTPSIGTMDIRIMGTIIPRPNTVMHGTVRDELYLSPMDLTTSSARSDASPRSLDDSSPFPESEAATHSRMAFLYPDACGGSSPSTRVSASATPSQPLVSASLTALENNSRDASGPFSAMDLAAVSRDPPDPTEDVIMPTTVGHSSDRRIMVRFIPTPPSFP